MNHEMKPLSFEYNALEPYIDAKTMEIHYSKHHQTYFDKFIAAIQETPMENLNIEGIISQIDENTPLAIRNNAGGFFNHNLFWNFIAPSDSKKPQGSLKEAIDSNFESYDKFKSIMNEVGMARFGSGFVWLVIKEDKLEIISTPNQDNPLMKVPGTTGTPIMGIDVWEHAYYLKYQNKRIDYLNAFWNIVNWDAAAELFAKAK
jgi:Fe-Mn family superoxide dismutase